MKIELGFRCKFTKLACCANKRRRLILWKHLKAASDRVRPSSAGPFRQTAAIHLLIMNLSGLGITLSTRQNLKNAPQGTRTSIAYGLWSYLLNDSTL